ncbi:MAG: acyl carrier protein [Ruminococcaceae bacterium]|nr:acyl carrier protein [Oscillospiraceae bacterium]
MFEKIKEILCENFDIDADIIEPTSVLKIDLGLDSLDVTEFIMCLEEEFDVLLDNEDFNTVRTPEDAVRAVEKLL